MSTAQTDSDESRITPLGRAGTIAATVAGACALALALYHVISTSKPAADYESLGGNLREIAFFGYLTSSIVAVWMVQRAGMATVLAARLIGIGYALVAVGVAAGFLLREDPDWFVFLGGPGNLLALIGWIVLGVTSSRGRLLPRWAAVLGAVGGVFAVVFAEFGSEILIATFWLYIAFQPGQGKQTNG